MIKAKWEVLIQQQEFPPNYFRDIGPGKLLHNAHDSHHLLAGFLLSEHHIFMQTLARLRE
jgi:hypothetical protein